MVLENIAGTKKCGENDDDTAATIHNTALDVTGETIEK